MKKYWSIFVELDSIVANAAFQTIMLTTLKVEHYR